MAKYRGPKAKISRTFGEPILGCEKVLKKKNYPPGQHGRGRKRRTEYDRQLKEKKKLKFTYFILERQLRNLVKKASAQRGITGDILMQLLEMRLDNTLHRWGICPSNPAARQFVVHRHIRVNGKTVDRPSFTLQQGDIVTLSPKAKNFDIVKNSLVTSEVQYPWLAWDQEKMQGEVLAIPTRSAIPVNINEKMIIEFYAR